MAKKTKPDARAKKVDEAIKLAYSSLESHLYYTHHLDGGKDMKLFHKKCVKEYQKIIQLLTELY